MELNSIAAQDEREIKKEPADEDDDNVTINQQNANDLQHEWFAFKCKSGAVLFYFNVITNEHRLVGNKCTCFVENVPQETAKRLRSIGIQCDKIPETSTIVETKDVSTEVDFGSLGIQEAKTVSVQTDPTFTHEQKSFKSVGIMTLDKDITNSNGETASSLKSISHEAGFSPDVQERNSTQDSKTDNPLPSKEPHECFNSQNLVKPLEKDSASIELLENQSLVCQNTNSENFQGEGIYDCYPSNDEKYQKHCLDSNVEKLKKYIADNFHRSNGESFQENSRMTLLCKDEDNTRKECIHDQKNFQNDLSLAVDYNFKKENCNDQSVNEELFLKECLDFSSRSADKTTKGEINIQEGENSLENADVENNQKKCINQNSTKESLTKYVLNHLSQDEDNSKEESSPSDCSVVQEKINDFPSDLQYSAEVCTTDSEKLQKDSLKSLSSSDVISQKEGASDCENYVNKSINDASRDFENSHMDVSYIKTSNKETLDEFSGSNLSQKSSISFSLASQKTGNKNMRLQTARKSLNAHRKCCTDERSVFSNDAKLSLLKRPFSKTDFDNSFSKRLRVIIRPLEADLPSVSKSKIIFEEKTTGNNTEAISESDAANRATDQIKFDHSYCSTGKEMQCQVSKRTSTSSKKIATNTDKETNSTGVNENSNIPESNFLETEENTLSDCYADNTLNDTTCIMVLENTTLNDELDLETKSRNLSEKKDSSLSIETELSLEGSNDNDKLQNEINIDGAKELMEADDNEILSTTGQLYIDEYRHDEIYNSMIEHTVTVSEAISNDKEILDYQHPPNAVVPPKVSNLQVTKTLNQSRQKFRKNRYGIYVYRRKKKSELFTKRKHKLNKTCSLNSKTDLNTSTTLPGQQNPEQPQDLENCLENDISKANQNNEAHGVPGEHEPKHTGSDEGVVAEYETSDNLTKISLHPAKGFLDSSSISGNIQVLPEKDPKKHRKAKGFNCDICGRPFKKLSKCAAHKRGHKLKKTQTCHYCLRTFRSYALLVDHVKYHKQISKYECYYCKEGFISHQKLVSHFIKCNETKALPHDCSVSNNVASSKVLSPNVSPSNHNARIDTDRSPGNKQFTCKVCNQSYVYATYFKKHLSSHERLTDGSPADEALKESYQDLESHLSQKLNVTDSTSDNTESRMESEEDGVTDSQSLPSVTNKDVMNETPLKCSICYIQFKRDYWFRCHMKNRHGITKEKSTQESNPKLIVQSTSSELNNGKEETISDASSEKAVKEISSPKNPFKCDHCGIDYLYEKYFNRHLKGRRCKGKEKTIGSQNITAIGLVRSPKCGRKQKKLRVDPESEVPHEATEKSVITNDIGKNNLFKCDICLREFVYFGRFEKHLKLHDKEKEALSKKKCDSRTEGLETPKITNLKSVFEIKEKIYPYKSSQLDPLVCSNNDNVVIGFKLNNFKCSECTEEFPHLDDLQRHNSDKHALHKCQRCEMKCSSAEELLSHMQTHTKATERLMNICCKICGKEVSTASELITHFRTHKRGRKRKVNAIESEEQEVQEQKASNLENQSKIGSLEQPEKNSPSAEETLTKIDNSISKEFKKTLSNDTILGHSGDNTALIQDKTSKATMKMSVYPCHMCNKAFKKVKSRSLHMIRSHGETKLDDHESVSERSPKKVISVQTKISINCKPRRKKIYKCSMCDKHFYKRKTRNDHKRTHEFTLQAANAGQKSPTDCTNTSPQVPEVIGLEYYPTNVNVRSNEGPNSPNEKGTNSKDLPRTEEVYHPADLSAEPLKKDQNLEIQSSKDSWSCKSNSCSSPPTIPPKDNINEDWKNNVSKPTSVKDNLSVSDHSSNVSWVDEFRSAESSLRNSELQYLCLETKCPGKVLGLKFKCYYCGLSFSSRYRRNLHIDLIHQIKFKETENRLKSQKTKLNTQAPILPRIANEDTLSKEPLRDFRTLDKNISTRPIMQATNGNTKNHPKKKFRPIILSRFPKTQSLSRNSLKRDGLMIPENRINTITSNKSLGRQDTGYPTGENLTEREEACQENGGANDVLSLQNKLRENDSFVADAVVHCKEMTSSSTGNIFNSPSLIDTGISLSTLSTSSGIRTKKDVEEKKKPDDVQSNQEITTKSVTSVAQSGLE